VAELVYPAVIGLARTVFRVQGLRFTMEGTEHVPREGGAVMVINHIGYLDFTYAGLAALPAKRLVRFMAKREVFDHRITGPLMRGMHHISVDREAGSASFREALTALKNGEIVGVFPEATISRSFQLKEFKAGAVRMAAAARVPLLPAVIWGSQRVWTKDHPKRLGRTRTPITVRIGEPLTVLPKADMTEVTDVLRDRMTAMLHEVQQQYPDRPADPSEAWWLPAAMGGSAPTLDQAVERDAAERDERARSRGKPVTD
jgi:1-acyl-sn-glycerol-3-phosphate acyltransferase